MEKEYKIKLDNDCSRYEICKFVKDKMEDYYIFEHEFEYNKFYKYIFKKQDNISVINWFTHTNFNDVNYKIKITVIYLEPHIYEKEELNICTFDFTLLRKSCSFGLDFKEFESDDELITFIDSEEMEGI